jgi:hypothetical protein
MVAASPMPSDVNLQLIGDTLELSTHSAETADTIWRQRNTWLQLWPSARLLLLRWSCPDSSAEMEITHEREHEQHRLAPSRSISW